MPHNARTEPVGSCMTRVPKRPATAGQAHDVASQLVPEAGRVPRIPPEGGEEGGVTTKEGRKSTGEENEVEG